MSNNIQLTSLLVLSAVLASTKARAQVASAILREGDVLIGGPAGAIAGIPHCVAVNNAGGYAVSISSGNTGAYLDHAWGHASGGAGTILRTEGAFPPYTQTSLGDPLAIDGLARVAYGASVTGGPLASAGSLWFDNSPIAVGGEPSSVPGKFWSGGGGSGVTDNGIPFFVAGLSSTSGAWNDSAMFGKGLNGVPLLRTGDVVPNVPTPITGIPAVFAVSALGTHWMVAGSISAAPSNSIVIKDGAGLMAGGRLVREDTAIPLSIGGQAGDLWDELYWMACNEAGDWMLVSHFNEADGDDVLVYNGRIRYREGDVIDGVRVFNDIRAAVMNEAGSLAYWWQTFSAAGYRHAVFIDDEMVLAQGDAVDLDGDGIVEPNSILRRFTDYWQPIALGPTGTLYVIADIDVNGTGTSYDDITAVLEIN